MSERVHEAGIRAAFPRVALLLALGLNTTFWAWFARQVAPADKLCPDYICYWAAGKLLVAGESPYDVARQTEIQHQCGWDKEKNGLGSFDFLPFYYPPWFAMLCAALVPAGYSGGRIVWFVLNADLILLSAYLLRRAVPGLPASIPLVSVPVFIFSLVTVILGQTTPLVLLLVVVVWRLLDSRHDRSGGGVLAWLTIKPQLTALVLLGVLAWAARRRRWGVLLGFGAMLAVSALLSSLLVPGWLGQMLAAPRQTPPPTESFPWIGTTWFLLLKSIGLSSWGLWGIYALVAVPLLVASLKAALDPERPLHDTLALGLLAACIVAPYGRHYDFPVLLIPMLVLIGTRLSDAAGTVLLVTLVLLPYLQYLVMGRMGLIGPIGRPSPEFLFAWLPLLLGGIWAAWSLWPAGLSRAPRACQSSIESS
jgi:hypothetical protein